MSKTNKLATFFLLAYTIVLLLCALLSESTYGGGDSWMHYQMARYAFKHPELFLDQWGKPLYTTLASLPSQFGFIGIKLFNIGCAILSAYFAFRMAKNQFEKYQWLAVVFVLSVPIYFVTLFTGLTESVFALCIMTAVFLFHIYRVQWACLVISFLPFIRSEGFLFLPLFAIVCIYYRRWLALPFLTIGFLVFTLIGYFFKGTWNWVFGTNVYLTKPTNYGHGPWYHFFEMHYATFGWAYSIFLIVAIVAFLFRFKKDFRNRELHIQVVLLFGGLVVYFTAHSYFWYKGIFGSAGLDRVMAGVGPCIGYSAFCGFQFIVQQKFMKYKMAKLILVAAVIWLFIMPRYVYAFPFKYTGFEQLEMDAIEYLKANKLENYPIYYQDPFFPTKLNKDPFDEKISLNLYQHGCKSYKPNSIIMWDSRLCPRESMLPISVVEMHEVELLQRFAAPDEYNLNDTMEVRIYLTK
ncbi:MAG: hypothetical protein NTW54_04480 [Bacteroidetes bacterium]|nr:hypothetical protein [Bacteroidota bacterium]